MLNIIILKNQYQLHILQEAYATDKPKKLLILDILDILHRYTDENHRLTQKQIADILKEEYNMSADRKAIRRNIMNLIDAGNHIEYTEKFRKMPLQDNSFRAVQGADREA